jgi:hypothetical protein
MALEPHSHFSDRLLGAPKDVSRPVLDELLGQGYDDAEWVTDAGAVDAPCIQRNGDHMPLADFIAGLMHDAPFYEKTHVGCKCGIKVTGPGLPEVFITAFGRG